jgi:hypothetical protein
MVKAGKAIGGGANAQHGAKGAGKSDPEAFDEFDLASDIKGKNSLQGNDQGRAPSERQAQADATGHTEGLIESFERADKHVRAREELGKKH